MRTIQELAANYVESRAICLEHAQTILRRSQSLANHVGCDDVSLCFRESALSRWLSVLSERVQPSTLKGYRTQMLTLWQAAADQDIVDPPKLRLIRPVKVPDPVIECYTVEEVQQLLQVADPYFDAVIRVAWDTGLRRGDIWQLTREQVRAGDVTIQQRKTGHTVLVGFRPETIAAVHRLSGPQPLKWPHCKRYWATKWKALVRHAGVHRGTFKWIRRSSGSYVELAHPGQGHTHLGHTSERAFKTHYDAGLGKSAAMPPKL